MTYLKEADFEKSKMIEKHSPSSVTCMFFYVTLIQVDNEVLVYTGLLILLALQTSLFASMGALLLHHSTAFKLLSQFCMESLMSPHCIIYFNLVNNCRAI